MEFQDLFDELEDRFSQRVYEWNKQSNSLHLQTTSGEFIDLLAPIIGVDFVAGLASEQGDWMCFSHLDVASLAPKVNSDRELPLLRRQEIRLVDFIRTLDRPVRVVIRHQNHSEAAVNLLDADQSFLICERDVLIPASGIIQLRVLGSNQWQ